MLCVSIQNLMLCGGRALASEFVWGPAALCLLAILQAMGRSLAGLLHRFSVLHKSERLLHRCNRQSYKFF